MSLTTPQITSRFRPGDHVSLEDYEGMIAGGDLTSDDAVELIRGEIVAMAPASEEHDGTIKALMKCFQPLFTAETADWSLQMGIDFPPDSRPEPDLALLRHPPPGPYVRPASKDVLLIIEISESSYGKDRGLKYRLYASHGVPEYWIVNRRASRLEIYRDPDTSSGVYRTERILISGEVTSCIAFPDAKVEVAKLL